LSARRGGLGRGLGALIPSAPVTDVTDDGDRDGDGDERGVARDAQARTGSARGSEPPTAPATAASGTGTEVQDGGSASAVAPTVTEDVEVAAHHVVEAARTTTGARRGKGAGAPAAGRRSGAALPDDVPLPITGLRLVEVDPSEVEPNPRQPREHFDDEELDGLAVSLRDVGMLQPLVVRPLGDGRYQLIAGERRWRAAQRAGLEAVPAMVRTTEDSDLLKEALLENVHRVQLNPLEEAAAYQQLLDEFGVTQDELATRLGRSRPTVSNLLRLLNLPSSVQRRIAAGVLSAGHAKALLALPDASSQERLADRVVREGMSVRATEEAVRLALLDEGASPRRTGGAPRVTLPGLLDLQEDLSDALMTRVRIAMGARRGHLRIDFLSVDDLERIVGIIADGLHGRTAGEASGSAPDRTSDRGRAEHRPLRAVAAPAAGDEDLADLGRLSPSAAALLRELEHEVDPDETDGDA
jgi:ParB family chromosome partitioning protein